MADQIVITEKSSQAKDVRAAVGSRYGDILPAEGHLFELLEPEDVVPEWKHWSPILLRPEGLYGTRPAEGGNKAAKLRAIREALHTAKFTFTEGVKIGGMRSGPPRRDEAAAEASATRTTPTTSLTESEPAEFGGY
jgi:hypothetical protein